MKKLGYREFTVMIGLSNSATEPDARHLAKVWNISDERVEELKKEALKRLGK